MLGNSPINTKREPDGFDVLTLSPDGQIAYRSLLEAERFEDALVGFAGSLSEYAAALDTLLRETNADAAFKSLLNSATLPGRLYALCGLFYTDPAAFQAELVKYKNSPEQVSRFSGCLVFEEKVSRIVESNASNVAIIGQTETLEDFLKTNPTSYVSDIAHGGYPATFRHFAKNLKEKTY